MVRVVMRYEVVEAFVSTSGQGGVHRAVCRSTGAAVALKQIEPGALGEARIEELHDAIVARRHPGLSHQVEVFRAPALDRPDGPDVLYVVSVWVEGVTLDRRAADARLSEIVDWIRQAAEALDFLHADLTPACPLLHRDVKPTNIVVTPDGAAVLIDPGLARRGPASVTGTPYGTPGFIPPERDADPTAGSPAGDRWQLAPTLVAALLGEAAPPHRRRCCAAAGAGPPGER